MKLLTLDSFDFKGKRVLLRSDLNSEVVRGRVVLGDRIIESAKTIKELKRKGARVVVMAHQGLPGGKEFISLRQHARLLNKYLKIDFVQGFNTSPAMAKIENLKNGDVLLLENVRNLKEEFKPSSDNKMVKKFRGLFDIYINDAFSVCHRNHTSIVSFPMVLKSGIGRLMEKELSALGKLKLKNCLFILGGAKTKDKSLLVKRGNRVLLTGLLAVKYRKRKLGKNVSLPVDFIGGGKDIGPKTRELYKKEIAKAKCILMIGPAGVYEDRKFQMGTKELLRAVAKSRAFSVIGGGNTVRAMRKFKIGKSRFGYVSLAGGALVRYLAGENLVGLEALEKGRKRRK